MDFKVKSAELEIVCGITSKLPVNVQAEFAFAGKSNVGKSSLINGLMNRKSLARTSAEPGKTQTINFYHVNKEFYLVDLPGYGYAKRAKGEVEKWGKMIENYLHSSNVLKQVFLLVDMRHEPGANDIQMYKWIIHQGYEPIIIATKADKLNRSQYQKALKVLRQGFGMPSDGILIPYSSITKQGRDEIYEIIQSYI
ncbi:ribosome biogenesis GTP-binding protein YihA/YsxC [Butyrivibrio sp. NC3005]|uniref:ribosome biogenesis GTP-binding protein YihA/YsxC n=1 Tax=Butyrivibrio sp. NC3005 TaxID=1280685 RepID=UPI00041BD496|nr:ribosome biogenesis GTP-binding protein YihA/YsxC [Butyrivibrio sp. NC3005]